MNYKHHRQCLIYRISSDLQTSQSISHISQCEFVCSKTSQAISHLSNRH
uniref:Uncharacterized protein n=1 Tax=Arundo donax TaxID=35708 RepID=A0A0A9HHA2_ARUDO